MVLFKPKNLLYLDEYIILALFIPICLFTKITRIPSKTFQYDLMKPHLPALLSNTGTSHADDPFPENADLASPRIFRVSARRPRKIYLTQIRIPPHLIKKSFRAARTEVALESPIVPAPELRARPETFLFTKSLNGTRKLFLISTQFRPGSDNKKDERGTFSTNGES